MNQINHQINHQKTLEDKNLEKIVLRKVSIRILPHLILIYIIAYIDRANISFAALAMNAELGFDSKTYGFAAGIFFIGYALFEIPSNILLRKFGARVWIFRIMVTWGAIVILTAFITSSIQLNILRFFLGLSEAGLFPGVILYMTYWFPRRIQAKAISIFMSAIPIALVIAGPISGWLVDHATWMGLAGWRWMFILEGAPAVFLGVVTFFFLTDAPQKASWLQPVEQEWLTTTLKSEEAAISSHGYHSYVETFRNFEAWILSFIYIASTLGSLGMMYFMPIMLKSLPGNLSNLQVGLISIVPYVIALVTMNYWGHRSDLRKERVWHAALVMMIPGTVFLGMGAGWFNGPFLLLVALCIAIGGAFAFNGPFWAIPPQLLTGSAAVVGIALINSIGNLGGFFGPYLIGYFKDVTGSLQTGFFIFAASSWLSAFLLLYLKRRHNSSGKVPLS